MRTMLASLVPCAILAVLLAAVSVTAQQNTGCLIRSCPSFGYPFVTSRASGTDQFECTYRDPAIGNSMFNCYYNRQTGQKTSGNTRCATAPQFIACSYCSAGYGQASGNCGQCGPGQASPGGASSCTTCPASSAPDATQSRCLCSAPGSGISLDNQCSPCGDNQYNPGTSSTCLACPTARKQTNNPQHTACQCQPGYGRRAGTAVNCEQNLCPAGQFTDGTTACQVCPTGTVSTSTRDRCTACPVGTFRSGDLCEMCPSGTVSSGMVDSCTFCDSPYEANVEQSECVLPASPRARQRSVKRFDTWR